MTDTVAHPAPVAAFRGPVACRREANALILTGAAADSADDILIVTFIRPETGELPDSLAAATIGAIDEHHYRIVAGSWDRTLAAASVHVHRDIGGAFYRAVPPRPTPFKKRLFWRGMLALASTGAGKRLLLLLRRRA